MEITLSDIRQFDSLGLLASQLVEGFITGLHKSPYHGFSVEFAEHKLYNFGESTRHVDWKVFSRTDRLYTKQYEEETNLRCHILIDVSGSMYYPKPDFKKIRFAALSAASICHLMGMQRDAFGITAFSDKIEYQSPLKSTKANQQLVFTKLSEIINEKSSKSTMVSTVLHEVAEKIHRRSLVVVFSDMFQTGDPDLLFKALQHLKYNKHEIILFHVTDTETELNFAFEERPYKFIDLESKETIRINPREYKDAYKKQSEAFYREIKLKCGQYKIDFVEASVSDPFNKILGAYLIKRQKMG